MDLGQAMCVLEVGLSFIVRVFGVLGRQSIVYKGMKHAFMDVSIKGRNVA
jgi:hypothetical protein